MTPWIMIDAIAAKNVWSPSVSPQGGHLETGVTCQRMKIHATTDLIGTGSKSLQLCASIATWNIFMWKVKHQYGHGCTCIGAWRAIST